MEPANNRKANVYSVLFAKHCAKHIRRILLFNQQS